MLADRAPNVFGVPSRLFWPLVVAVVAAAILTSFGTFGWLNDDEEVDENSELVVEWLLGSVLPILVAAVVVAYTGTRLWPGVGGNGLATGGLIFGILAFVSIAVFWAGIYAPFGVGALVFGFEALRRGVEGGRRIMAGAGMLLGAAAIVIAALLNLFG